MRIGAHPAGALRGELGQFGPQAALAVEQFLGLVALHPLFEDLHMVRVLVHVAHRHLMRAPVAFGALAVDLLRAGPPLGVRRTIIGQSGRFVKPFARASVLMRWISPMTVSSVAAISWCIACGSSPSTKYGRVAIAAEQVIQFLVADARQHAGIGDLVAVQMQDRQHRAIGAGIQKFVGMPTGRQRTGLRFAVADDAGDDQIRVVEGRSVGVRERVAQFAAFVNRARRFRRDVAGNAAGKENCLNSRFMPSSSCEMFG